MNNNITSEKFDFDEKIKNKMNQISDENISDQNEIDQEDIKTTIIRKKLNIYDKDNEEIENESYIDENYTGTKFNISTEGQICNQPKSMNYNLCEKMKEMFSFDKNNNNSMYFIYNLDKKSDVKRELIFTYDFKKIENLGNLEKKQKIEKEDSKKNKENKTIENNETEFNVGHIFQINHIKKINPKNTNKYLPVNSNKKKNDKKDMKYKIKKKLIINLDNTEKKDNKNKSISESKNNYFKKKYKTNYANESIIDTHYLIYSDIPLGVPQNIIDNYKLFKKKKPVTPENRRIEYLRTYEEIFNVD